MRPDVNVRLQRQDARIAELEAEVRSLNIALADTVSGKNHDIAELEAERDKWHQDAVNQMHKYGQLSDELLALTAERDNWKAAAEARFTRSVL